jgi:hypothetical protein
MTFGTLIFMWPKQAKPYNHPLTSFSPLLGWMWEASLNMLQVLGWWDLPAIKSSLPK